MLKLEGFIRGYRISVLCCRIHTKLPVIVHCIFIGNTIEYWSEDEDDLEVFDSSDSCDQNSKEAVLVTWLVLYLLRLQSNHYIPDAAINS